MKSLVGWALILLTFSLPAYSSEHFATVESLSGGVSVSGISGESNAVKVGDKLYSGQTITTTADGEAHLDTADGGIIAIRPNTVFRTDEYRADGDSDDKIFMSLLKGSIRSITGWIGKFNSRNYRITTPSATIGIRGTDHETTVIEDSDGDEAGTYDMVNDGTTIMKTPYGEHEVKPEQFSFAPKGRAIAPFFLTHKPKFWGARKLKLEQRIWKRRAQVRGRINKIREQRIKRLRQIHAKQSGQRSNATRTGKNREGMHKGAREQAGQHRRQRQHLNR